VKKNRCGNSAEEFQREKIVARIRRKNFSGKKLVAENSAEEFQRKKS
jgi:hypothetical protein